MSFLLFLVETLMRAKQREALIGLHLRNKSLLLGGNTILKIRCEAKGMQPLPHRSTLEVNNFHSVFVGLRIGLHHETITIAVIENNVLFTVVFILVFT